MDFDENTVNDPIILEEFVTPDQIFHGQRLERIRSRNDCIIDCIFFPCVLTSILFLLFCAFLYLPLFTCCCCYCIYYFTMMHKPKNAPCYIKFFSLLMKIGFFFFQDFPVRWGQNFTHIFQEIRSFIMSIRRRKRRRRRRRRNNEKKDDSNIHIRRVIENIEYYDWFRNRNYRCKCFVYEEEEKKEKDEQQQLIYDDSENEEDRINNEVDNTSSRTPLSVVLIFYHGGGFMFGHPEDHCHFFDGLIKHAKLDDNNRYPIKIYAPQYRLSPRYKVDSILREAVETLKYIVRNNRGCKFVVCGDSAGGNLSVLLAHYLRDTNYKIVSKDELYIIPIYPILLTLDNVSRLKKEEEQLIESSSSSDIIKNTSTPYHPPISLRSRKEYGKWGVLIYEKPMKKFEELTYENDPYQGEYNRYDFFKNMSDLPPHLIVTSEYDFLRDDGEIYYRKLLLERLRKKNNNNNYQKKEENISNNMNNVVETTSTTEKKNKKEEPDHSIGVSSEPRRRKQKSSSDLFEKKKNNKKKKKTSRNGSFEYFQYYCMGKEFHGFTINYFQGRKDSKSELINLVLSNIKKRFLKQSIE